MQIDRQKTYQNGDYQYKNFVLLSDEEKLMVLEWRNSKNVRKWMLNSDTIPLESHLKFVESLKEREDCCYWLVLKKGELYGVACLADIDYSSSYAVPGSYRNPNLPDDGSGLDFFYNVTDFFFFHLGLETLSTVVDTKNNVAVLLNAYLGYEKTGIFFNSTQSFYKIASNKKDIERDWEEKNNITKMMKYYRGEEFRAWFN